jgi:hypothetical protein
VVFKLSTKQPVSVNRVTVITPAADHIKFVEDMAEAENQPKGLEFADINGKFTLEDFMEGIDDDDNDCNASNDDFVHDEDYQTEFNEQANLERNEGLAVEDQADAFGNDIQQLVQDPTDRPALKNTRLRPRVNGRAVALSHETEECGQKKKKKKKKRKKEKKGAVSFDNSIPTDPNPGVTTDETLFYDAVSDHPSEDTVPSSSSAVRSSTGPDPSPDPNPNPNPHPSPDPSPDLSPNENSGVDSDEDDTNSNPGVDEVPSGLDCSLNQDGYQGETVHSTYAYVLNTVASFTDFQASKSTPQYGSNRGMKEFGELGFEATMKELDDNLIGMGAVWMLNPSEVNKDVWSGALSYLMFLKRKRDSTVKARGCADGRPQREYISKDESSSPTVSIYALMASCLMHAINDRKVVTCDIPGAFLQAD